MHICTVSAGASEPDTTCVDCTLDATLKCVVSPLMLCLYQVILEVILKLPELFLQIREVERTGLFGGSRVFIYLYGR